MDEHNLHAVVIDAIPDPVLVLDAAGEILLTNPAAMRMLEVARDRSSGNTPAFDGHAIMDLLRRVERVRSEPAPVAGDASRLIDVEPLPGTPKRWLLRVRSADVLEREFWSDSAVATVAHEIRNPITAMINALDALNAGSPGLPPAGAVGVVHGAFERSARRLARLVDGLLDLSRVRTGALQLHRARVPLDEFVTRVTSDFRALHPVAGERVQEATIEPGMSAYVDPDRAEQALWNLLANAVRFTPRTEKVVVRASAAGMESLEDDMRLIPWEVIGQPRLVRIDVEDSGLGMTSETLEHLFERHHASGGPGEGAHLGLSITRALVEAHEGWMTVESQLGEGTTVSVFVPADAATATLLAGLRLAGREAARRWAARRATGVVVLERTSGPSWARVVSSWPRPAKLQPEEPVSPRECAVWALSTERAVAIVPLSASGDPADAIGAPVHVEDDGAWVMEEFIAGWCGDRDRVTFAQSFHRAASRMVRARMMTARESAAADAVEVVPGAEGPAVG